MFILYPHGHAVNICHIIDKGIMGHIAASYTDPLDGQKTKLPNRCRVSPTIQQNCYDEMKPNTFIDRMPIFSSILKGPYSWRLGCIILFTNVSILATLAVMATHLACMAVSMSRCDKFKYLGNGSWLTEDPGPSQGKMATPTRSMLP